jgi:hypothetical protein
VLASSTLAGCIRDVFVCQHPIFVFRQRRKSESLKSKIILDFRGLPQSLPPIGAALFGDGRVIEIAFATGKPPYDKSAIFLAQPGRACGKLDQTTSD